jgi:UDP-N-acetylglucosamine 4,6-dehydratase/5-epimerase
VVRYGNVVGSRGSVIPLFLEQRKNGKLTITDPRMTRFWITLEQGVQFVIMAIDKMKRGEIFVPKLPSMKMTDLARAMAPECELEVIGIRPGEKLHEVMVTAEDSRKTLEYNDHFVITPNFNWWKKTYSNGGKPVEEGFVYSSDINNRWLGKEELMEMIGEKL